MFDVGFHVPHEIFELLGRTFTSIIILQNFDSFSKLAFNKSLELHELCKTFTFLFHEVIESFFKHVIYERHEILHSPKVVFASPQMLEWINSRTSKAFDASSLGKSYQCCFSSTHLSQNGSFFPSLVNHKPSTRLHCVMSSTLKCPSHSCHK